MAVIESSKINSGSESSKTKPFREKKNTNVQLKRVVFFPNNFDDVYSNQWFYPDNLEIIEKEVSIYEDYQLAIEEVKKSIIEYQNLSVNRVEKIIKQNSENIIASIQNASIKSEEAHSDIILKSDDMQKKLEKLLEENNQLKKLLTNKFQLKYLLLFISIFSLSMFLLTLNWFFSSLKLMHPIISIPALITGVLFMLLALYRYKTEKNE